MKDIITKAVKGGYIYDNFCMDKSMIKYLVVHPQLWDKLIFSHEFAKAYWGDKFDYFEKFNSEGVLLGEKLWQYHLQQLVLSEDRIKYLRSFL